MADEVVPSVLIPSPDPDLNPDAPDVPRATLKTMAEWVSALTKKKQDRQPSGTDPDNKAVNAFSIEPPSGDVQTFPMDKTIEGQYDNRTTLPSSNEVPGLKKGDRRIGFSEFRSGHEYLKKAQSDSAPVEDVGGVKIGTLDPIVEKYTSVVLSSNRWTSNSVRSLNDPFVISGKSYTQGQLSNVGGVLTTRACSELSSGDADFDVGSGTAESKAILPGYAQLGMKRVEWSEFDAISALCDGASGPSEEGIASNGSWGQMNNPLDQYSGMSAMGMAALSIALFVASTAALMAFNSLLGIAMKVTGGKKVSPSKDGAERYFLGQYGPRRSSGLSGGFPPLPMDSNLVANLMGVRPSQYDWTSSVEAGLLRFYGSDKKSLSSLLGGGLFGAGSLTDAIGRAVESPGYYSGVSRMVMRSGVVLIEQMKNIKFPNVLSGIKNLIGFFDTIRQSKFIAALNAFASIGEVVWRTSSDSDGYSKMGDDRYSSVDYAPNEISSVTKNRLQRGDSPANQTIKLAWSSNRAVSILTTPNVLRSTLTKAVIDTGPAALVKAPEDMSRLSYVRTDSNRIPIEIVEYVESVLDAEYVPFYFHDVRTNEIVSFHAFIASLTDDFSPSWESMDGVGRVEPVRIYKNTSRKISLSFHIVSTSESDFDEMWTKINKLVTMVYPQYTEGKIVQDSDSSSSRYRFVVPFSQLPSASPIVRIRLGDLFKSNYSKFALARLFGMGSKYVDEAGDQKLMVDGTSFLTSKPSPDDKKKVTAISEKVGHEAELSDVTFLVSSGVVDSRDVVLYDESDDNRSAAGALLDKMKNNNHKIAVKIEVPSGGFLGKKSQSSVKITTTRSNRYLTDDEVMSNSKLNELVKSIYVGPMSIVTPPDEYVRYLNGEASSNVVNQKFSEFMSDSGNALVRSFKQSGGKGLAAAIDSLNFDWYSGVLWETKFAGWKAPMSCKVSISLSPMHDISPGIDHNGYNRAPVYPVASSDCLSFNSNRSFKPLTEKLLNEALLKSNSTIVVSNGMNSRKT